MTNLPSPESLRITVGQINPTIGDLDANIELMLEAARKARLAGSDVVVFPELSLTGYSPADLLDDPGFAQRLHAATKKLHLASRETPNLHWVVGLPLERKGLGGKRFFNGLQVLLNGDVLHGQHKQLLPTYGVFDERRHFEPGADRAGVVRIRGVNVGFLICEDGWNDECNDYAVNPWQRLSDARVDLVVSINASPSHVGKRQVRHSVFSRACRRHSLPLLYVAQVGGQDQLVYDGASFAVDARGRVVYEAARFEPATDVLTFQAGAGTGAGSFAGGKGEVLAEVPSQGLSSMAFYRQQIILGLRDYARRCGFKRALVGCSGGIDSALTLALAAEALGAENVVAITMPSVYSSAGSVSDSEALCRNLGLKLHHVPIKALVDGFSDTLLGSTVGEAPRGLALENLQARIRGTLLMTYSNQYGHLLLTTGNKSEIAVGYCTLYGDTNGGLGLIGDLYKTEVFELSRHINETAGREVIPAAIIDKPPSAELAPDQKDSDALPPYEVLDEILKVLLESDLLSPPERSRASQLFAELAATPEGKATIEKVQGLIARSEYKRRQAAPVIRVRPRAFGSGRQVPITARQY